LAVAKKDLLVATVSKGVVELVIWTKSWAEQNEAQKEEILRLSTSSAALFIVIRHSAAQFIPSSWGTPHFSAKFDSWYKQPLKFSCQLPPKSVKLGLGRGRLRGMIGSNLGV